MLKHNPPLRVCHRTQQNPVSVDAACDILYYSGVFCEISDYCISAAMKTVTADVFTPFPPPPASSCWRCRGRHVMCSHPIYLRLYDITRVSCVKRSACHYLCLHSSGRGSMPCCGWHTCSSLTDWLPVLSCTPTSIFPFCFIF